MGLFSVIAAALASWVIGAGYYMALANPWMAASGVARGEDGKPANGSDPLPYILSALCMVLVAGMMRHIFAMSGIDTPGKGAITGLGIGLFFISPWIMINNAYGGRPFKLTVIDGGYAVLGCTVMGIVLGLF